MVGSTSQLDVFLPNLCDMVLKCCLIASQRLAGSLDTTARAVGTVELRNVETKLGKQSLEYMLTPGELTWKQHTMSTWPASRMEKHSSQWSVQRLAEQASGLEWLKLNPSLTVSKFSLDAFPQSSIWLEASKTLINDTCAERSEQRPVDRLLDVKGIGRGFNEYNHGVVTVREVANLLKSINISC